MAFVDPNEQNPAVAQPANQSAPVAAGGAGIGGATRTAASTPGVNVPQQPSAQLSAYLSANQPQTTAYAGQVANTLGGQTAAAGNAILPAVNTYTGNLYNVPTDTGVNQQVATSPSALTPEQAATYQKELGAGANVPNSANTFETTAPYQGLVSGIQNAVQQASLWNSGNNIANISTGITPFEGSNATAGDKTLDSLLISGTPGAYDQVANAVAPAANLQSQLASGTAQANAGLQGAITQDTATTAAAQGAAQTYATNLTKYLQDAVDKATSGDTAQNAKILSDLKNNTPTADDLATLNLSADQWKGLQDTIAQSTNYVKANPAIASVAMPYNVADYLSQTAPNVTAANIATPTQYADVAALQNLLGAGNAPVMPISGNTAAEAGTAPTGVALSSFNLPAAQAGAKIAYLEDQAQGIANYGAYARNQYNVDHFGGQSPDQFNNFISGLNSQLHDINSQIAAIQASAPTLGNVGSVGTNPNNGGVDASSIAEAAFPLAAMQNLPVIGDLGSIFNDIGNFFGFAEGGEVRKKDNLAAYLGAT